MDVSVDGSDSYVKLNAFECPICHCIMQDAVATNCGHCFCKPCLQRWLGTASRTPCPTCRESVYQIIDLYALRKVIDSRDQACPACSAMHPASTLARHVDTCLQRTVRCSCGWAGTLQDRAAHPTDCGLLISCMDECPWLGTREDYQAHVERCGVCMQCPTCEAVLKRGDAQSHDCPNKPPPAALAVNADAEAAEAADAADAADYHCCVCREGFMTAAAYLHHVSRTCDGHEVWKNWQLPLTEQELRQAADLGASKFCIATRPSMRLPQLIGAHVTHLILRNVGCPDEFVLENNAMPNLQYLNLHKFSMLSLTGLPNLRKLRFKSASSFLSQMCVLKELPMLYSVHVSVPTYFVKEVLKELAGLDRPFSSLKLKVFHSLAELPKQLSALYLLRFHPTALRKFGLQIKRFSWEYLPIPQAIHDFLVRMSYVTRLRLTGLCLTSQFLKQVQESRMAGCTSLQVKDCKMEARRWWNNLFHHSPSYLLGRMAPTDCHIKSCEDMNAGDFSSGYVASRAPGLKQLTLNLGADKLRQLNTRRLTHLCLPHVQLAPKDFVDLGKLGLVSLELPWLLIGAENESNFALYMLTMDLFEFPVNLQKLDLSYAVCCGHPISISWHRLRRCRRLIDLAIVGQPIAQPVQLLWHQLHRLVIHSCSGQVFPPHLMVTEVPYAVVGVS